LLRQFVLVPPEQGAIDDFRLAIMTPFIKHGDHCCPQAAPLHEQNRCKGDWPPGNNGETNRAGYNILSWFMGSLSSRMHPNGHVVQALFTKYCGRNYNSSTNNLVK